MYHHPSSCFLNSTNKASLSRFDHSPAVWGGIDEQVIRRCTREYEYVRLISTEGKIKVVDFIPCRHTTINGTIFVPRVPFL
jgi:hypothetical protein